MLVVCAPTASPINMSDQEVISAKYHLSLISYSFLITVPRDNIAVEEMNVADFRITTSAVESLDNYSPAISFGLKGSVELLLFLRMRSSRWIPPFISCYLSYGRFLFHQGQQILFMDS